MNVWEAKEASLSKSFASTHCAGKRPRRLVAPYQHSPGEGLCATSITSGLCFFIPFTGAAILRFARRAVTIPYRRKISRKDKKLPLITRETVLAFLGEIRTA